MSTWSLVYKGFAPEMEGLREALCVLGNGYFATRGAAPEAEAGDVHYPGTYVAGLYNRLVTEVAGRDVENEDLVNVPNWLCLGFRIDDGPWFDLQSVAILDYRLELDMRRGLLLRTVDFRDENGRHTTVAQRRFVHMGRPHLAGLETTILAHNWSGRLQVRSALDGRVLNTGVPRYRQLNHKHLDPIATWAAGEDVIGLGVETNQSRVRLAQAARTRVLRRGQAVAVERQLVEEAGYVAHDLAIDVSQGEVVTVEKVAALYTSKDRAITEPRLEAGKAVRRAEAFDTLVDSHAAAWGGLWDRFRTDVGGDDRVGMILNLHVFHLLQTVSHHSLDLDVGIPARGWHGEAYRGHIFWDEMYIFPLLNYRMPELTRSLLMYRYRRLGEARWAAAEEGYAGAMFPWQSSSNGREETQVVHLNPKSGRWLPDNSHRQRHVNLAIAYNVWQYFKVTGDDVFLSLYGAEMLLEIARFWSSITEHNGELDRYEIKHVMGPDEYHDGYAHDEPPRGLDNNAYTNVMAVWLLGRAQEALDLLPEHRRKALMAKLGTDQAELDRWDAITRKMRVCFHGDGVISQFEGYGELEELDWARYRAEHGSHMRLDRILEAEGDTPNRFMASKQADLVMLFYLLSPAELREIFERLGYTFTDETIARNVAYYLERTSHGSTLSQIVHAWVLARTDPGQSWDMFTQALESDVADVQGGTTPEGVHLGAMAGTVDIVQRCYSGLAVDGDTLLLDPSVPVQLGELAFPARFRGHWLDVRIAGGEVTVRSAPGHAAPIEVRVRDKTLTLAPGTTEVVRL